jgi:hypothetical protein
LPPPPRKFLAYFPRALLGTIRGMSSSSEPKSFRAGETVAWTRDLPQYSADDGWVLKYRFFWPAGVSAVTVSAVGDGTVHSLSLSAAETALMQPGAASIWAYVERFIGSPSGPERVDLGITAVQIGTNLLNAGALDPRSSNQRALDDLRAALAAYASGGSAHVAEYQIGDRTMKFRSLREIQDLIAHYEREIRRINLEARPRVLYRG